MKRIDYLRELLSLPRFVSPQASRRFEQALLEHCHPFAADPPCSSRSRLVIYNGSERIIIKFLDSLGFTVDSEDPQAQDRIKAWLEEEI